MLADHYVTLKFHVSLLVLAHSRQSKSSIFGLERVYSHPKSKARENDPIWANVRDMVAAQDNPWPPPVFTHADLNPFNILVQGDRIIGLIDWEFSGWYPHYWEYTSAWLSSVTRTEWQGSIDRFLEPFPPGAEDGGYSSKMVGRVLTAK